MLTGIPPEKHPPSLPYRPPAVYAKKTGPLEGTFAYGERGGIEYKPNWGQPIGPGGKWLGQQEAQSFDVDTLLQQNLDTLWSNFKTQAERLRNSGLAPEAHNKILAGMQAEYDQTKAKFDFIKNAVASGSVNSTAANEAMARLVLPAGVADAMFPQVKAGPQPSLAGTTPGAFGELLEQFEATKPDVIKNPPGKHWWAKNVVDPDALEQVYINAREIGNYNEPRNIGKIAGLNNAFVAAYINEPGGREAIKKLYDKYPWWFAGTSRLTRLFSEKVKGKPISPLGKLGMPDKSFRGASAGMTYPHTPKGSERQKDDPLGIL